jgi:hypothetical protein
MYTFAPGGDGVAPAQAAEAASKLTATLGSNLFTVIAPYARSFDDRNFTSLAILHL